MLVLKLLTSLALRKLTKYLDDSQIGGATPPTWYCHLLKVVFFDIMPTPYKTVLSVAATAAFFIGIPSVTGHLLDKATRHQCLTHDWPVNKHQNMMNFCDDYGYLTEHGK